MEEMLGLNMHLGEVIVFSCARPVLLGIVVSKAFQIL